MRTIGPSGAGSATVLLLAACGLNLNPRPDPTHFYLMTPVPSEPQASMGVAGLDATLGLGPLQFAPYLEQDKIVTRTEPNRVEFADFERWAEPFPRHFERVLRQVLVNLLQPRDAVAYPWFATESVDYQIQVAVRRFDRTPQGGAEMEVDWWLSDVESGETIATNDVVFSEPATATGPEGALRMEDSVAAMSRAIGALGRELATAVKDADRAR